MVGALRAVQPPVADVAVLRQKCVETVSNGVKSGVDGGIPVQRPSDQRSGS